MLITHATIATLGTESQLIEDGAILIRDHLIEAIGDTQTLTAQYPEEEQLDAEGQLAMPAAICGHTHFYGAFARGWAYPGPPAANFTETLERLWWRLDKQLTLEDVRYSALVCLIDAIRHGTTTLIDHHAGPNAVDGSLDVIADAIVKSGLRASLAYEVSDRDGPERAQAGIAENVRFARRMQREPNSQLAASFGLHASLTLSDATLADAVAAASDLARDGRPGGFHIHGAEGIADVEDSLAKSGKRAVARLAAAGILGPQTIVAHAVHVDTAEIALLAETGTWVTHQPRSNMNNAVGFAHVETMLDQGVKIALGNDGFSNNMIAEMKTTYLTHKLVRQDPRAMPADLVVRMAYGANAALARIFWPQQQLGALTPGAVADLVLIDYHPTTPLTTGLLTLDEAAITARSRELAAALWARAG
jgi:putative selenium metabolism protein SsnA